MKSRAWSVIICVVIIASVGAGNAAGISGESGTAELAMRWLEEGLDGIDSVSIKSGGFPFQISGSKFLLNGEEVFLSIIGYSPLQPEQDWDGRIDAGRIRDDLRRLRDYQGGTEPVVLRVYPGPTAIDPNRRIPKFFYDEVRKLGFWVIRDIYFDHSFCDANYVENGQEIIEHAIAEVNAADAFDVIFSWEIGNEFVADAGKCMWASNIKSFVEDMCGYIKQEVNEVADGGVSDWVSWGASIRHDELWTEDELPVLPDCLDYVSYNVYSYEPARIRDHQAGPVTGTPYQGYLAALKAEHPNQPLVITEMGLSDSGIPAPNSDHERFHPWYPAYRKGGLSSEQVAEGLAERYWDARLLRDVNDANIVIAGLSIFEWKDEWWKAGNKNSQSNYPEEHFGLGYFAEDANLGRYQLRYKLQQEVIRDLYTLKFDNDANIIESVVADSNALGVDANTWVHAVVSDSAAKPVRLRWEASRGYIIGDPNAVYDANRLGEPNSVKFYSGKTWLGPARITVAGVDANGNVGTGTTTINIETSEPNGIEILTFGDRKSSGRVHNVDLDKYKLACYLLDWRNKLVAKPYFAMKSIWINDEGYWWTPAWRGPDDELFCWLVPRSLELPDERDAGWEPNDFIAEANTVDSNDYNDVDNDLVPDYWEKLYFGAIEVNDRYDDPDGDMGNNLEEFLTGTNPEDANDDDNDGLWDNWERHFFGDVNFYDANHNPDGDKLNNLEEEDANVGTHPCRVSHDKDRDGLPDMWELRWFSGPDMNDTNNPDGDCFTNLDEYELGLDPTSRMGDLNVDCDINLIDFELFASRWKDVGCNEPEWCGWADVDRDGKVDFLDLDLLCENWLRSLW